METGLPRRDVVVTHGARPRGEYDARVPKRRITITLDEELVIAGGEAVRAGRADALSGYISDALVQHQATERRLAGLAAAVAAFEAEHGAISEQEMADQERQDRSAATVVRPPGRRPA
jgi:hypothetical protein